MDARESASTAVVAATWPEVVTDDCGMYWVRLDQEHRAREFVDAWDGSHMQIERHGRHVMVRDPDLEDGLLVAEPGIEHDEAAVYVAFEAYEA